MLRRDFLKLFAASGLVATAPKFIFDYGANLYKVAPPLMSPVMYKNRLYLVSDFSTNNYCFYSFLLGPDGELMINPNSELNIINL